MAAKPLRLTLAAALLAGGFLPAAAWAQSLIDGGNVQVNPQALDQLGGSPYSRPAAPLLGGGRSLSQFFVPPPVAGRPPLPGEAPAPRPLIGETGNPRLAARPRPARPAASAVRPAAISVGEAPPRGEPAPAANAPSPEPEPAAPVAPIPAPAAEAPAASAPTAAKPATPTPEPAAPAPATPSPATPAPTNPAAVAQAPAPATPATPAAGTSTPAPPPMPQSAPTPSAPVAVAPLPPAPPAASAPATAAPPAAAAPEPSAAPSAPPPSASPANPQTAMVAPPPTQAPAPQAGLVTVAFTGGQSELPSGNIPALDSLAQQMADTEDRLQIRAYAASSGSDGGSGARRLALSRALAVRAYLIDRGIRSTRIDVRALGTPTDGSPADRVEVAPVGR